MLSIKPDSTPNVMLVTPGHTIKTSTYDNSGFVDIKTRVEKSGVIELTAHCLYGKYFAELANAVKKHVIEFTRARELLNGWLDEQK